VALIECPKCFGTKWWGMWDGQRAECPRCRGTGSLAVRLIQPYEREEREWSEVQGEGEVEVAGVSEAMAREEGERGLVPPDEDEKEPEWVGWWKRTTEQDLERLKPKVAEYGAGDLELMGAGLSMLTGGVAQRGQESAIAFYALGKIARIISALEDGRSPSDDSWLDLEIYARMARRVRVTGGVWPGGDGC